MPAALQPYCLCFAIPLKAARKLAEKSADPAARHHDLQARASAKLRVRRHEFACDAGICAPRKPAQGAYSRAIFDARRKTVLPGVLARDEGAAPASDADVNDAYDNAGLVLTFMRTAFGRKSIDGQGMRVESAVHFGKNFGNAMWNGSHMIYGDGNDDVRGFTRALDIIAHELAHGLSQHLVPGGLGVVKLPVREREFRDQKYALRGQAGALNESFSDIVGSMVKQWHHGQDVKKASWLIGEHLLAPHHGRAVRSLKEPGNTAATWHGDDQLRSMAQYWEGCDPHDASGIANHAFYLAATKMGGKSWEGAGPVWYDAYGRLAPQAGFADAAAETIASAEALHGKNSVAHKAVKAAWRKVEVIA